MKAVQCEMYLESEKKNSYRYDAVNPVTSPLTAIYIAKKAIDGPVPEKIRVTITDLE